MGVVRAVAALIGSKVTMPIAVVVLLVAAVAIWHHVHVIMHVVRALRRSD